MIVDKKRWVTPCLVVGALCLASVPAEFIREPLLERAAVYGAVGLALARRLVLEVILISGRQRPSPIFGNNLALHYLPEGAHKRLTQKPYDGCSMGGSTGTRCLADESPCRSSFDSMTQHPGAWRMADRYAKFSVSAAPSNKGVGRWPSPFGGCYVLPAWMCRAETATTAAAATPARNGCRRCRRGRARLDGAEAAKSKAPAVDPALPELRAGQRDHGPPEVGRLRHDEQSAGPVERRFSQALSQRADRNRRQGLGHGSAGIDSGDGRFRPDEPRHESRRNRRIHGRIRLSARRNCPWRSTCWRCSSTRTIRWKV